MSSLADIVILGVSGKHGDAAPPALPANPDYAGQAPAPSGTYSDCTCYCAINGQAAGSGNRGNHGGQGFPGLPAPTLGLIVSRLLSDLVIVSQGGSGGQGAPGGTGTDGGLGQDSGTNDPSCLKLTPSSSACCNPAVGGPGGDAGGGGDGGPGGAAGDGGDIYIYYMETQTVSPSGAVYQVLPTSAPGSVGGGGGPGSAGNPGLGGYSEAVGATQETRVQSGATANAGGYGPNGQPPGQPGTVIAQYVPPGVF